MGSCNLNEFNYEGDIDEGALYHYCQAKKVTTKAICSDCGEHRKSKQYYSYPAYKQDEDGHEKRANKTWYLCEDCQSLSEAFDLSTIGSIRDTIRDNFFDRCYEEDFDIELLDKLTPGAREFVLDIIHEIQEEE